MCTEVGNDNKVILKSIEIILKETKEYLVQISWYS